jgi:S-adenosylmethionine:tRNA ribosyltransferase-isomerase
MYFYKLMINIQDYTYVLPDEKIAKFPLPERDQSKLLVYKNDSIQHTIFSELPALVPKGSLMVFNNTRVIPARLHFQKETGAIIEVFLLDPIQPSSLLLQAMQCKDECTWHCTIGNLKRWHTGQVLQKQVANITLRATLMDAAKGLVKFAWDHEHTFAEVVDKLGETPLPPYLKRKAEESDKDRYQTVYSQQEGAVAAPTAGLHFTPRVLQQLLDKGVMTEYVTLHVSAGTFQPVKTANALDHPMHQEQIVVSLRTIQVLLNHRGPLIPVGTTSMRTLESLYWMGVRVIQKNGVPFEVIQTEPYTQSMPLPSREDSLKALLYHLSENKLDTLIGRTSIYIHPGYAFRMCDALITNFHQPGSTLMLLVAALIGEKWKDVYASALANDYRFLSYGDSSLLWRV